MPTAVVPPLYPLALTPFFALGVDGGRALALFGILLGSVAAGLIASIGRRAFGVTEGWVAGLPAAGLPSIAFWSPYVLTDMLSLVLLAGAVLALVDPKGVSPERRRSWACFSGRGFSPARRWGSLPLRCWSGSACAGVGTVP